MERALNSLKIWQKTKALKMRVMCRVLPISMGGGGWLPGLWTHQPLRKKVGGWMGGL